MPRTTWFSDNTVLINTNVIRTTEYWNPNQLHRIQTIPDRCRSFQTIPDQLDNTRPFQFKGVKMKSQNLLLVLMLVENIMAQDFDIVQFDSPQGLYYQYVGYVRTSHSNWDLVTYIDLDMYSAKYATLANYYNATASVCGDLSKKMENSDVLHSCKQFAQATLPYVYEIESNHRNIFLSIGQEMEQEIRTRRGLGKTIGRLANVLYGTAMNLDIESIIKSVVTLVQSKRQNINIPKDQTRMVQTDISEANDTLQHILRNEQKIGENVLFLQTQTMLNTENLNKLMVKEPLVEQALLFEIILNQYAYETQNLIAIVNSAIRGEIHTSVQLLCKR